MTKTLPLPGRRAGLAVTAFIFLLVVAAVALAAASAAHAAVWVIPGTARAFPSTAQPAGAQQDISLKVAGGEYEAAQVALRGGGDHRVVFTWSEDSDPLITRNATLARVAYVNVRRPTTDLHARRGLYPDPLLPREFGAAVQVPATTTCFYVKVHVPYGTPTGDYAATLHVQNGAAETVDLPVTVHVYAFGWERLDTHTAFPLNVSLIKRSLHGRVAFTNATKWRILNAYFQFMAEYGLTPSPNQVWPRVSSSGHIGADDYADRLAPYMNGEQAAIPELRLPWLNYFPWSQSAYSPSSSRLATYLYEICRVYQERGWSKKAYAYILDETIRTREERKAEAYARALHRASARAGFRCRFLLTDEPRPRSLGGIKTANRFLFDDVDIWVPRYYYFFGRIPALRQQQRQGKEVWWYFYANHFIAQTPALVIEKPQTEQRVIPWLMQQWGVDGFLNWGINRWANALTGRGYRDPYADPLSARKHDGRVSNGETSLIYPGYYPRYDLNDPYAGPVSSLRLEALRDGFEDQEYLRLATQSAGGANFVSGVIRTITWYPYTPRTGNVYRFPKYTKSPAAFLAARAKLASWIETHPQQ